MYIPVTEDGEPYFSEGFVVKFFKDDLTEWIANFKPGWSQLSGIYEFFDEKILVIAGGICYLMNPNLIKPISCFGRSYNQVIKSEDGRFILADNMNLTIVEITGQIHESEMISYNGFKDLKIQKNIVSGFACDYTFKDECVEFSYDIDKKFIIGGFDFNQQPIKKPLKKSLWKFWN